MPVQLPSLNPYVNDTLRCTSTQSALNERPAEGSNIMIVGHGFAEFGSMCTNMDSMIPGTAVIYKPRLGANARYIGLVNNLFWQTP